MKNNRLTSFYKRIIPVLMTAVIWLGTAPVNAYAAAEDEVDTVSEDISVEEASELIKEDAYDTADEGSSENTPYLPTGLRPIEFVEIDESDIDTDVPSVYLDLTEDEPVVSYSGFEEYSDNDDTENPDGDVLADEDNIEDLGGAVYTDDYWDQYTCYYTYNQMNDKEKALYNALSKVCIKALTSGKTYNKSSHGFSVGNVSFSGLSSSRAMNIGQIFCKENPQYYFLNGWVGWSGYSGSTSGNLQLYGYPIFANGKDRTTTTSKIRSQLDSWMTQVNGESTAFGKEKKAHDLLIAHTSYEFGKYDQSIYSAIIEKRTVCSGYAGTMMMLFNAAGFDSQVVCSSSHAWNTIRINGTWYYVDATWDDTAYSNAYLNVSDSEINRLDTSGSHSTEKMFKEYLPVFTRSNGGNTLPAAYGKLDTPVIAAALKSGKTYTVMITGQDIADLWYTTSESGDAPVPGSAYSKAKKYTKPFTVKYGTSVKVKAEKYDYLDSDVAECTRWVRSCKITYDLSKGVNDSRNPAVFMNDDEPFELYAPTRSGYYFDGWYTDKKYTNRVTKIIPEDYNSNIKLYAKWVKASVNISDSIVFLKDGETASIYANVEPDTAPDKTILWTVDKSAPLTTVSYDNEHITIRASASDIQKKTVISASNPNVSDPAKCTVVIRRKIDPDRIVFNKTSFTMEKSDTAGLILQIEPYDAEYESISYSISNTSVVNMTIPDSGDKRYARVNAVGSGTAVIYAKVKTKKGTDLTCTCNVTVAGDDTVSDSYHDVRSPEDEGKEFWIGGIRESGYKYTGSPIKPDIRVYKGYTALKYGTDYTVSYKNNKKVNDGSSGKKVPCVTVKFKGNYKGTISKTFKILADFGYELPGSDAVTDISSLGTHELDISIEDAYAAKGGAKPEVTIYHNTAEGTHKLAEGRDYMLTYSSNKSVSKQGKVKITGIGAYKGSKIVQFTISKQSLRNLNMTVSDVLYSKSKSAYKKNSIIITDLDGMQLKAGTDYTVKYEVADNTQAPTVGTDIYITVTGKGNYTDSINGVYTVKQKSLSKAKAVICTDESLSNVQKSLSFTGTYIEPTYIKIYTGSSKSPIYLTQGVDYEIAGYRNNIKTGKASVIIRGMGEYGGIITANYNIVAKNVNK